MSEKLYIETAQKFALRVKNKYQVLLSPQDMQKLEAFTFAMYWIDQYFDQDDSTSHAEKISRILEIEQTDNTQRLGNDPKVHAAVDNMLEIVRNFPSSRRRDFYAALKITLESGEKVHQTTDIPTFLKMRRREAMYSADLCSLTFADKIDLLEKSKREIFWRDLRNYSTMINFADSLLDARKDWKSGEIKIPPHVLRFHLIFSKYPGKPPYFHYARKYFMEQLKQSIKKRLNPNALLESLPR